LKYICCCSGGKDSIATVILAHLTGEPLDVVIFSEVFYDLKRGISGEFPEHIEFIKKQVKPLFEEWGIEFSMLHAERDYLDCFNRRIKNPRKHMEHKGLRFGFPCTGIGCAIKRDCKIKPIKDYIRSFGSEPVVEYIGIAADEELRLRSMHKTPGKVSLLEKYGYTEQMALELCEEYNLVSPVYKRSNRNGCWFCAYSKEKEHLYMKKMYPEIWNEFVALEDEEDVAYNRWNVYKTSLRERDKMLDGIIDN